MNHWMTFGLGILVTACAGAALPGGLTANVFWGFDDQVRAREWVSPDGRMGIQSQIGDQSTAIDLWPTAGATPREHSLSELTLQRYLWGHSGMERFNISAMVDQTDGGAYRFGVEKGGTGQYRPIIFCFEAVTVGDPANCPLRIQPDGVYVKTEEGYKKL